MTLLFEAVRAAPEHANFLLFGEIGSGKSVAAATAPGPILWINAEGPGAIAYPRLVAEQRGTTVLEAPVRKGTAPAALLHQVMEHVRHQDDEKDPAEPRVNTVVVDTVGKLRDALLRDLSTKPTLPQYGEVSKMIEEFVYFMRDQPINLVLLCHEEISDADGERIVLPLINEKLSVKVPGEMDIVAYCGVTTNDDGAREYLGQLTAGRGRRVKARGGWADASATWPLDLTDWLARYSAALAPPKPVVGTVAEPEDEPERGSWDDAFTEPLEAKA